MDPVNGNEIPNTSQMSRAPRLPPVPPTLNAIRITYMNLFNQILNKSVNINCICKTTSKDSNGSDSKSNPFDGGNEFMDDDEDEDDESNDVEMSDTANNIDVATLDHVNDEERIRVRKLDRSCDLACFEIMKHVHFSLKNCFHGETGQSASPESIKKFENSWSNFKFLSKYPKSCDYFGSTMFHLAASNDDYYLLKEMLNRYPDGVNIIDSKGMTPLMKAVQRGSYKCAEFLLSETKSDINGSEFSAFTPLWFCVSNGNLDLVKLLLNYNASPSIVDKSIMRSRIPDGEMNILAQNEDASGVRSVYTDNSISTNSYLLCPIRTSIAHSRFEIMNVLLDYNTNVYELSGSCSNGKYYPTSQDDFVNLLKFLSKHFSGFSTNTGSEHKKALTRLNDFIDNPNIYRKMMLEFVNSICSNLTRNGLLIERLDMFLNESNQSTNFIFELNNQLENKYNRLNLTDYINIINDFIQSICMIKNSTDASQNGWTIEDSSAKKSNHEKDLFEFSVVLIKNFYYPRSLKELSRFKLRKLAFEKLERSSIKYKKDFLKINHLTSLIDSLGLPNNLKSYLLHAV